MWITLIGYYSSHCSFFFFFKLYIIVLVLPNFKMNPPQVYILSTNLADMS